MPENITTEIRTEFTPPAGGNRIANRRLFLGAAILVPLLTFLAYLGVLQNGFVNWDDPALIQNNLHLRSVNLTSLKWMFTPFMADNWVPLTWLSLSLDYQLGKLDPRVYHLHNLLLHCLNSLLAFLLAFRIFRMAGKNRQPLEGETPAVWVLPAAFLAALLFGLHPIHVESVAWASERKDVLCGFFFFLSLLAYWDYAVSRPGQKARRYFACLAFFVLALMSKPIAITLPLVLLVLDGWPLGRLSSGLYRPLVEKTPFLILSSLSGWLTVLVQAHAGALTAIQKLPLDFRVANAFQSFVFYLWKMLVPKDLAAFYPLLAKDVALDAKNLSAVSLVILAALACYLYRKKFPFLSAGFLYYGITLAPVLGVLQFGYHTAADRYTYLPSLGPFMVFSAVMAFWLSNRSKILVFLTVLLVLGLGIGTFQQIKTWKDPLALWMNVIRVTPENTEIAFSNLGDAYHRAERPEDSLAAYDRAVEVNPSDAIVRNARGTVLAQMKRLPEAEREFKAAAALKPQYDLPHLNLWNLYLQTGRFEESLKAAQEAVRINPAQARVYDLLGVSYGSLNRFEEAIAAFQKALALDPENREILKNLSLAYQKAGKNPKTAD